MSYKWSAQKFRHIATKETFRTDTPAKTSTETKYNNKINQVALYKGVH